VTAHDGFWSREQVAAYYLDRTGRSESHLDVYLALACLKLAVIMESIRARSLSGLQLGVASGEAAEMGAACEALVQLGLATTRTRGAESVSALAC
jgi:aminoglycoside phosphotransferase (APT) family kinase protein